MLGFADAYCTSACASTVPVLEYKYKCYGGCFRGSFRWETTPVLYEITPHGTGTRALLGELLAHGELLLRRPILS